jgi:predicted nucleic acid-binding protein
VLVDTDWVVDYLKAKAAAVELLNALVQAGLAISLITYGEIYEGVYYGRHPGRHEQGFLDFLRGVDVLAVNRPIMAEFARLRGHLRVTGQMVGDLDLLIAATALHHSLPLLTRNTRHFGRIPNLTLYPAP